MPIDFVADNVKYIADLDEELFVLYHYNDTRNAICIYKDAIPIFCYALNENIVRIEFMNGQVYQDSKYCFQENLFENQCQYITGSEIDADHKHQYKSSRVIDKLYTTFEDYNNLSTHCINDKYFLYTLCSNNTGIMNILSKHIYHDDHLENIRKNVVPRKTTLLGILGNYIVVSQSHSKYIGLLLFDKYFLKFKENILCNDALIYNNKLYIAKGNEFSVMNDQLQYEHFILIENKASTDIYFQEDGLIMDYNSYEVHIYKENEQYIEKVYNAPFDKIYRNNDVLYVLDSAVRTKNIH